MTTKQKYNDFKNNSSKVIGMQFSILSPAAIRESSVAEITTRDTYINNKPVIGGLFDPRMGVLEPGLICPTDGLDYMSTPGYFGHIELARPVFYIQYLSTIIKITRCVCIKCSKLLISKEKYKYLLKQSPEDRWNQVFALASKKKRCGEDTDNGCGCKQPNKIKKESLATIIAEWDNIEGIGPDDTDKLTLNLTPERILQIFKRITDEDVTFMGFNPLWSRPDWMICEVLAVPPPAVRPSVKHDAQQRSEDDISHIIVDIIKTNKILKEKIEQNANPSMIDDWTTMLQYYVATQIDNKIPGVASVAQRSGRPLKSMKERLVGKGGRVRGNLMGKRVDYSARSVITPDPNLSIEMLGVPLSVAKNITRPIKVNSRNMNFLLKLIHNGPDNWPGAKILEKKNGDNISLRYIDRNSITLDHGDIVHRHMMDGDYVIFNRQPTLHRMSMMGHRVKILQIGNTFRMNVGCTKPYNADFDGDEMNLHMPQQDEAEIELRELAAVPYQMVSPANNKPIIGIFQDSLLGAYLFSADKKNINARNAMNLLATLERVDLTDFKTADTISNYDILTQIIPPLSLKYKTKQFKVDDNFKDSPRVLDIRNGNYHRGQIDKGVVGDSTKGLIHRICNDFGNKESAYFIDNLQNIVTEYMKTHGFSVGISDLIADNITNQKIIDIILSKKLEVKDLIDQVHLGIFENNTGKTMIDEFETQVNNILNKASAQAGKIGHSNLSKDNRFVIIVNAGSKGSILNISQMISCLGQQNVDGKRIPYGFEDRTLPHYTKYNDSPEARGFVESSFISGLTPQELFFHAMGGRVGLIDTAVKTSETGYIQRRLIKGMEDLTVRYDMTVRNSFSKIVQFRYGDDGFDTVKVENQNLPLINMSLDEIYTHYYIIDNNELKSTNIFTAAAMKRLKSQKAKTKAKCHQYIESMVQYRDNIVAHVFKNENSSRIHIPVAFPYLIDTIQGQCYINSNSVVDITPLEMFELIEQTYNTLNLIHYCKPTELFKAAYYFNLSPRVLLSIKRFNRRALILLLEKIVLSYKQAIVAPGECTGMIAAQSIGEPTTQLTLNTFHFSGVASKSNVTRGVPRIKEILSLSENPKNPSLTIYPKPDEETSKELVQNLAHNLEYTNLESIVKSIQIYFDPDDSNTLIEEDNTMMQQYHEFESLVSECMQNEEESKRESAEYSKWIIRLELDHSEMLDKNLTMDDINFTLKHTYKDDIYCVYSDYNSDKLIFRIRLNNILKNKKKNKQSSLDQSDEIYMLQNFQNNLLKNIVLRGVPNINKVVIRKINNTVVKEDGIYKPQESWVLDTIGTNLLDILGLDSIDFTRTFSNDIIEIYKVLGIEAARRSIYTELTEVIEFDGTYINYHHLSMLCDRMTCSKKMISIFRHGINNDNIGVLAKASFEETPEMFLRAARHGELDPMRGISANVMCGQEGYYGTGCFQTLLDINAAAKMDRVEYSTSVGNENIEEMFGDVENPTDYCSKNNIIIQNNTANIKETDMGEDSDYEIEF